MAPFALSVIRLGLKAVSTLSPEYGARLAYQLFCTTDSRKPKGAKQRAAHAEGEAILSGAQPVLLSLSDCSAMTYLFDQPADPGAPRVLVVHGWGSGAAYLAPMAAGLHAAGNRVVALDLPGHGRSSGRILDMRRAAESLQAASREHGPFDAIVAHSFGGAATIVATSGLIGCVPRLKAGRLVIIGAPSRLDFIFGGFIRIMRLGKDMLRRMEARAEQETGLHPDVFDGARLVAKLGIPALVIHARDDKEVPADNAEAYEGVSPRVTVQWADGLGHRRIVRDQGVIDGIARFIAAGRVRAAA